MTKSQTQQHTRAHLHYTMPPPTQIQQLSPYDAWVSLITIRSHMLSMTTGSHMSRVTFADIPTSQSRANSVIADFLLFRFAELNIIHCIYHFTITLKFRNNICGLHPNVDCKLKLPLAKSNLPRFVKLNVPNTITLPLMVKYTGRLRGQ